LEADRATAFDDHFGCAIAGTMPARRERTNTPLQALLTMNATQYFEAARHLGYRMLREAARTMRTLALWIPAGDRADPDDK
jgi:hypothetical protein